MASTDLYGIGSRNGRSVVRRNAPCYIDRGVQSCARLLLASVQEGFGSVFLEAMAAGKPIVAALNDSRPAGVVWVTEIPRSAIMI